MIAEWWFQLSSAFVTWLAGVFGVWTPPAELTSMATGLNGLLGTFAAMGVWVNWTVLGLCVGASVTVWGGVLVIKLIRAVAAHIPAFGGAGD